MKYQHVFAGLMRIDGKEMHLPPMKTNPFSTIPLEASDSNLLVGRHNLEDMLSQYLRFRSSRRILLTGEHGSGRTSLLRCLAKHTPHSVYIDHISPRNAGESLLKEIYASLVSTDVPAGRSLLSQKILAAAQSYRNSLPLIVIDASTLDIGALNVALRETLPTLERLEALMVVVLETKDKTLLHESILQKLDQIEPLSNLSLDEVQLLVERRIEHSTGEPFRFSQEDAEYLLEKTNGLPSAVVHLMRDSIDQATMSQRTYVAPSYSQPEPVDFDSPSDFDQPSPVQTEPFDMFSIEPSDSVSQQENEPDDVAQGIEEHDEDAKIMENLDQVSNFFELDLGQLDEEQAIQEELKPLETVPEGFNAVPAQLNEPASRPPLDPSIPKGLAGLFVRNRDNVDQKDDSTTSSQDGVTVEDSSAYMMWVDDSLHQVEEPEVIPEEESAKLLYDEIGLPLPDLEVEEVDLLSEEPIQYFQSEERPIVEAPTPTVSNDLFEGLADIVPVMKALHLALLTPVDGDVTSQRRLIIEALERMQSKKQGMKQDYALNTHVLSALTQHEMAVISVANDRTYSPSDEELLSQLKVKRARLSQISNRLLKFGILSVRSVGRNRHYDLTQAARAQLIAWNVIGGEA